MSAELKKYMHVAVGLAERAKNKIMSDPNFDAQSHKADIAVFQLLIELMKEQIPNEDSHSTARQAR